MLTGKRVLITGSSRGIGAAIARLAVQYGSEVILHGRMVSSNLINLADELHVSYCAFDITNQETVVEGVSRLGKIDILVNNAGINPSKTFFELRNTDWQEIFDVNIFGLINVTRQVASEMLRRNNGSIVNIASIKGFTHIAGKPAYASSKAALIQLSARLAEEFAPHVRVNAVAPGFTETKLTTATLERESLLGRTTLRGQISKIPMERMATQKEIAEAVLFFGERPRQLHYRTVSCGRRRPEHYLVERRGCVY